MNIPFFAIEACIDSCLEAEYKNHPSKKQKIKELIILINKFFGTPPETDEININPYNDRTYELMKPSLNIKEISKWTYHIKKPQEDEMYIFQTNGTEMELERTIQYIQLDPYGIHTYVTFTRKSNSKQYKLQQDTTIFITPFDIKLVNKQELLEQQLQTSPPTRHGKTWLTEQLKRINEKLRRK